jgi:hypothetical protein
MTTIKTQPARLSFKTLYNGSIIGRLVDESKSLDKEKNLRPVSQCRYRPIFVITPEDSGFSIRMRGAHPGGTRYTSADTLVEAQKIGQRWAGRRFRILSGPQPGEVYKTPGGGIGRYIGTDSAGIEWVCYKLNDSAAYEGMRQRFLARA